MDNSTFQPAESPVDGRAPQRQPLHSIIQPSSWKRSQTVSSAFLRDSRLERLQHSGIPLSPLCDWRKLFSVWVGVLAPSVTYVMLQQLFSR